MEIPTLSPLINTTVSPTVFGSDKNPNPAPICLLKWFKYLEIPKLSLNHINCHLIFLCESKGFTAQTHRHKNKMR